MRLSFELTEAQQGQLNAIAQRLNVPVDALAAAALRDLLDRREAAYEIGYELAFRPDWVAIPLDGLLAILDGEAALGGGDEGDASSSGGGSGTGTGTGEGGEA